MYIYTYIHIIMYIHKYIHTTSYYIILCYGACYIISYYIRFRTNYSFYREIYEFVHRGD